MTREREKEKRGEDITVKVITNIIAFMEGGCTGKVAGVMEHSRDKVTMVERERQKGKQYFCHIFG